MWSGRTIILIVYCKWRYNKKTRITKTVPMKCELKKKQRDENLVVRERVRNLNKVYSFSAKMKNIRFLKHEHDNFEKKHKNSRHMLPPS